MKNKLKFSIFYMVIIIPVILIFAYYTYQDMWIVLEFKSKIREKSENLIKKQENLGEKHYDNGKKCYNNKEYEKAIIEFKKVLEYKNGYCYNCAYGYLIDSYRELNKDNEAEDFIKKDIEREPKNSFYYARLIDFYIDTKRHNDACILAEKSSKIFPDDTGIQSLYSFTLNHRKEYKKAENVSRKILEKSWVSPWSYTYTELAYSLYKQGRDKESEYFLKKYYEGYDEGYGEYWGDIEKKEKDFASMIWNKFIRKRIFPKSKEKSFTKKFTKLDILRLKGYVYLKHEPEEAIGIFELILKEEPRDTKILKDIARGWELLGDEEKVKEVYQNILKIKPGDKDAKKFLGIK